jgi:hypothetical protein
MTRRAIARNRLGRRRCSGQDIPMLWRSSDLPGFDIKATDGAIGSVDDFLFSDDDWIVRWAVIDTGNWLPGRQDCGGRHGGSGSESPVTEHQI